MANLRTYKGEEIVIKGEYDYLKALAEINECAEHGTPLVVATHPSEALWVLRCGEGHYPDTIRRIPTLTEEFKQGTLPSGPVADNIIKGSKRRAMSTNKQLQTSVLGELPRADLATGEMLMHVEPENPGHHHRCYLNKATDRYILVGRRGTEFIDLESGDVLWHSWARGVCKYGIMPCNGLLYAPPHPCGCYVAAKLTGFNALAPKRQRSELRSQKSDYLSSVLNVPSFYIFSFPRALFCPILGIN